MVIIARIQKESKTSLLVIIAAMAAGMAVSFLPPYWITLVLGLVGLFFCLAKPNLGLLLLLIMLYFPIFPNVPLGSLEFSTSTIPVLGLAVAAWIKLQHESRANKLENWQKAVLATLSGVFLVATLISSSLSKSLILLPNLILYVLILFALMVLVQKPEQLIRCAKAILVLVLISAFWRELQPVRSLFNIPSLGVNGQIYQFHPAFALCLVAFLADLPGFSRPWRWLAGCILVLVIVKAIEYQTRAAWLTFIVVTGITLVRFPSRRVLYLLTAAGMVAVVGFSLTTLIQYNLDQTRSTVEAFLGQKNINEISPDDQIRLAARDAGLRMFREKPLLGWGPNLFDTLKPAYVQGEDKISGGSAFDSWLEVLAEMGTIGAAIIGFVYLLPFLISWKAPRQKAPNIVQHLAFALALGVVGLSIHLFFIDLLYGSFAWLHVGLALAAARISMKQDLR